MQKKQCMIAICVLSLHMGIFTLPHGHFAKWSEALKLQHRLKLKPNLQVAAWILARGDVDSFYVLV